MSQYALNLSLPTVFSEDNFVLSGCNREAFHTVTGSWQEAALLLWGAAGSGKTHLGHIWAIRHNARIVSARNTVPDATALSPYYFLDDIDDIDDEEKLLHLINYSKEKGCKLLMTASSAPGELGFALPDLTSRLRAFPTIAIKSADDEALAGCLRKQFADRQLKVSDEIIDYIVPRMMRSFAAAGALAEQLDKAALKEQRKLTIPFVKSLLED